MRRYLALMCVLGLMEIGLALYLTEWRHTFWDIVAERKWHDFLSQIAIFTGVALILCFVSAYATYCGTLAAIQWRVKLNTKAFTVRESRIENVSQRIQEDCREYPNLMITVGYGTIKAVTYIVVFSISLILQFNWLYLCLILVFSTVGTVLARYIAYPLIHRNYEFQRVEASYRHTLCQTVFQECLIVMFGLAKKTKHLQYFQTFYGQIGVIVPLIIVAPAYFTYKLTLGGLMQASSIMSTILDNLSYGINTFGDINRLISCRKRLKELGVI